ncbi:MAG: histidine kinase [Gemmatimonadaceae bacterium]|nr:histidine kinase [Gemmatimonadaceae bacterium]NUR21112.1 histidine kinase [Gemmatimonadaceae bacterium]
MTGTRHESSDASGSVTRLTRGEIVAIVAFWAFLAALTAAGRLVDPRVAALAAMRAAARPEPTPGVATLALVEYALWALLTLPIFWMARRFGGDRPTLVRVLAFLAIGLVLAVATNALLQAISEQLMPRPQPPRGLSGRLPPSPPLRGMFFRYSFLYDFLVYVVVLGAGLARNYLVRHRARLEETRRLQAEAAQLQAQLADARLNALRTQLNPHFLFNTLNAISTLVEQDPRGVRRMIARLGDLLRHTLDEGDEQEIPLARELEMLRRYLEIMEVRFQGNLDVSVDADVSLDDALVPNLVLQPLVENAFRHGLASVRTTGRVEVRAARDAGDLVLTVRDNGAGPAKDAREGVGLTNTRARLAQLYGARQRLTLRAGEAGGAVVEVRLPYHTAAERGSARDG